MTKNNQFFGIDDVLSQVNNPRNDHSSLDKVLREQPLFELEDEDYQRLKIIADNENRSVADLLDIAVKRFIESPNLK